MKAFNFVANLVLLSSFFLYNIINVFVDCAAQTPITVRIINESYKCLKASVSLVLSRLNNQEADFKGLDNMNHSKSFTAAGLEVCDWFKANRNFDNLCVGLQSVEDIILDKELQFMS